MKTGIGWPSFIEMKQCKAYFIWRSKFGCRVCDVDELDKLIGDCKDGVRIIKRVGTPYCIYGYSFEFISKESCNEFVELITSWQAILVYSILGVLILVAIGSCLVYCKYKKRYNKFKKVSDIKNN